MTGWGLAFGNLASNVGVSMDWIILIIAIIGSLIFFAKDFRIGIILLFLSSGLCSMLSYALGTNYAPALIIFFMSLVIMALSLYAIGKQQEVGGIV